MKWSEVEALLLQRAQEIDQIVEACLSHQIVRLKDRPGDSGIARGIAMCAKSWNNTRLALIERVEQLEAQLTARVQEIEQVKAEPPELTAVRVAAAVAADRAEWARIQVVPEWIRHVRAGEDFPTWGELYDALRKADAARVSRAPQLSENQEDASRVAPLKAGAAATGSTAEDRTGNAESAERTNERENQQDCGRLGHLFGASGRCMFCDVERTNA